MEKLAPRSKEFKMLLISTKRFSTIAVQVLPFDSAVLSNVILSPDDLELRSKDTVL